MSRLNATELSMSSMLKVAAGPDATWTKFGCLSDRDDLFDRRFLLHVDGQPVGVAKADRRNADRLGAVDRDRVRPARKQARVARKVPALLVW